MNHGTGAPLVSICMVTYGAREWVARSLDAVVANTPANRYEIVVVDNASTDGTDELLRDYAADTTASMQVEYSTENLGFAAGNDLAANLARGGVLCFLNSDALVPPGWFDELLAPLVADASIGATLPLFVDLAGRLQEAGTNVEPDGRVEAFGIRGDADDPRWSLPRRVSYGSAACWMIRSSTFRRLGGFDASYGIGYYEDVDFAFELARRGLRLELVPAVQVVHAQGASSPSSEVAVTRRDANQQRFVTRQHALLAHRWHTLDLPNEPHRYYAARDVDVPRRVLVVSDHVPRAAAVAELQDPGTRTTVALPSSALDADSESVDALRTLGIEVVAGAERAVRDRLFLLDAIVAPQDWLDANSELLDEHQPQARRLEAGQSSSAIDPSSRPNT